MPQMTDVIKAKPRQGQGKGDARKSRRAGQVPAKVYGPGTETQALTLTPREFSLQRAQFGLAHIYNVELEGKKPFKALIREIQQDPVSDELLHVDLYALDMTKPVRVEVVVELTGKPAGAIDGGVLQQVMRKILVECLPSAIPQKLTADISALKVGDSLHISELNLPAGVKSAVHGDGAVAMVFLPREEAAATPVAAAGDAAAAGAAPAEGAAAAPGKDGDKAAPAAAGKEGGDKAADKGKGGKK